MKIFVLLLLISGSLAFRESPEDWVIQLVDKNDPNGKININVDKDCTILDEILSNPDPRAINELYVSSQTIENMTRIFEVYGSKVTKVNFNNAKGVEYKAQDVFNVLNMLPSVETLAFSYQEKKFSGDVVGTLNMPKLTKVELWDWSGTDKKVALDFLAKVLPENSITSFDIRADKDFGGFLIKQRNIKTLKLSAENPEFDEAFNDLKLEKLELYVKSNHEEHLPRERKFMKAVVKSQPDVKHLTLTDPEGYNQEVVDDEIFAEVSKLSKLESLVIPLNELTTVDGLQNLKNLKEIKLKSIPRENEEIFNIFSTFKYPKMEKFSMTFYEFLPSIEALERMSNNMPNLKSFRTTINAFFTIDTYARLFPQVEELSIRFGQSNRYFPFNEAFDGNSKVVNENVKKIDFYFQAKENVVIDADKFVAFLKIFPNLESLDISSKLPFTAEFFTKLNENLNNLKVLELSSVPIDSYETFPAETSNAIKSLASKLKYVELHFVNTRKFLPIWETENYNEAFTFKPFIDAVKDVYKCSEGGMAMLHSYSNLMLEAGEKE